jgi:hypothetical protein
MRLTKAGSIACLLALTVFNSRLLQAQQDVTVEVTPDDKVEVAYPFTGLDQELETSNTLAAESWAKVNDQISFVEHRFLVSMPYNGERRFYRVRQIIPPTAAITEASPQNGAGDVAVTRETVIRFNTPLSESTTIDEDTIYADFGGERLATRIQLSEDRRTLTLFYTEALPGGAQITVFIDGNKLEDIVGRKIDADSDGNPGGIGTLAFNTLNLATIPGTAVVGQVLASELGEENGQPINMPLEGVTISLDGKEDTVFAVTDTEGNFKLEPVPGGEFFVHIDGRTATTSTYPDGAYYPFVGKSWKSIPGQDTTLAGGTGVIHLPLIQADSLNPVSSTSDTEITFTDEILQEFPELNGVTITVPANSLFSDDGSRGGSVGIAPVPPDRLPGQLPEMLQFPIVFTVQTDGASNFDTPALVRFPNLPDPVTGNVLPPGAKTALWSFNHDSGRWEIQGSMTISADGLFAVSDPGVGIRSPGWVGVNPGSGGGGPKKSDDDDDDDDNDPDRPDRDDDRDDCTMEVICTVVVSKHNSAFCLLNCAGNILDRIWGDEEQTPRSPIELGLCVGNALDCGQQNTMDDMLNSDKYDDSLSSKQTDCMDECMTPNTATFPAIVPCEGFVDPCPENLSFSEEEVKNPGASSEAFYENRPRSNCPLCST